MMHQTAHYPDETSKFNRLPHILNLWYPDALGPCSLYVLHALHLNMLRVSRNTLNLQINIIFITQYWMTYC